MVEIVQLELSKDELVEALREYAKEHTNHSVEFTDADVEFTIKDGEVVGCVIRDVCDM